MPQLLIYGAYGYTGELIARRAVEQGLQPVLAGRRQGPLRELAIELGLGHRTFDLEDPARVVDSLGDVDAVLHCAGPFLHTAGSMATACIAAGTHYLDITGEIEVFEGMAARSDTARDAGVVLMPGVGFDVVPTDCLALHLKNRLPSATHLTLAFATSGGVSRGTARTSIERIGSGGAVRRNGEIVQVPAAWKTAEFEFGCGRRTAVTIPWGDVATAFHTTDIPNVTVYAALPAKARKMLKWSNRLGWLLGSAPARAWLERKIDQRPPGPDAEARENGRVWLWGEVSDAETNVAARMTTPEGYQLTSLTAVEAARRVLASEVEPGFHTPAGAFGADFILGFDSVVREDVGS